MQLVIGRSRHAAPGPTRSRDRRAQGPGASRDSICERPWAEAFSLELCRFYRERMGSILHHNVDKALIVAGRSRPCFGGGRGTGADSNPVGRAREPGARRHRRTGGRARGAGRAPLARWPPARPRSRATRPRRDPRALGIERAGRALRSRARRATGSWPTTRRAASVMPR